MSDITPREPWRGYAEMDEAARDELLAKKFADLKEQNDSDYAMALAAAVANYELVLDLAGHHRGRAARQDRARPA